MPRRHEGRTITADGKTLTIIQWETWRGWQPGTIHKRIYQGWSEERAVTVEPRKVVRNGDVDPAERRREKVREQRRMRAEAGLCIHCGLPAEAGKTQCREHLDAANRSMSELQTARRELGMCLRCEEPAQPGFATCEAHAEYERQAQADARAHKISIGVCTACTKRAVKGHVMCRSHLATKREEWIKAGKARRDAIKEERRVEGLCTKCGERRAVKGSELCKEHRAQMRAAFAEVRRKQIAAKKGIAPKGAEAVRPGVIKRRKKDSG